LFSSANQRTHEKQGKAEYKQRMLGIYTVDLWHFNSQHREAIYEVFDSIDMIKNSVQIEF